MVIRKKGNNYGNSTQHANNGVNITNHGSKDLDIMEKLQRYDPSFKQPSSSISLIDPLAEIIFLSSKVNCDIILKSYLLPYVIVSYVLAILTANLFY